MVCIVQIFYRAEVRCNKYTAIGTVIVPRMILSTHGYSHVNVLLNSVEDNMLTISSVMIDKYLVIRYGKTVPQLYSWY